MASPDQLTVFACTDSGRRREHNEDSFLVDAELGLFVVADGMGGHAAGEVASALAVATIHERIQTRREAILDYVQNGPESDVSLGDVLGILEEAIKDASRRIHTQAQNERKQRGMGTTCSLLLLLEESAYVAHVGDSRIYLVRNGTTQQITDDHTIANELIKAGIVSADQIHHVPRRNAITRAVGVYEHVDVDTLTLELLPGDQLVLASDGLTGYLDQKDRDLAEMLIDDGDAAVQGLIDFANDCGGKDNTTAIIVRLAKQLGELDTQRAERLQLKREMLTSMALFSRLDDRELLRVMQVAQVSSFEADDVVVAEGEIGDRMYVALAGALQVRKGPAVLSTLGPGDHFGEMSLIRERPRSATVTATEPSEVLTIHREDFFDLLRHEHRLGVKLLWQFLGVLANRLEHTSHNLSAAQGEAIEPPIALIDDEPSLDPFSGPISPRPSRLPRPRTLPGIDQVDIVGMGAPDGDGGVQPTPPGQLLPPAGPMQTSGPSFDDAPELATRLPKKKRRDTSDDDPITQPRPASYGGEATGSEPGEAAKASENIHTRETLHTRETMPARNRRQTLKSVDQTETRPDGALAEARKKAMERFVPTKETVPLQPHDELREELAELRAEFKKKLAEARAARETEDDD